VVASDPIVHVAVPFPLGQRLVNSGCWSWGVAVSVTDTPEAGPFSAETCTVYDAAWPGLMLDWDGWTLTHSSAGFADEVVEGEAVGDADAAAGSGSHWELRAVSAAAAVVSADAAGMPCGPLTRPQLREPPAMRQAASTRMCASRLKAGASQRRPGKSPASGARGNAFSSSTTILPGILSGY